MYTISSGELGHKPSEIHQKLTSILELGENWDAVVLLGEADVFLAKRSDHDLMRNAIVAVFLRELEYYQGIILLTTNMAPNTDPAFQSRIHVSLQYPDLDAGGRRRIWQNFIIMATARNKLMKLDVDEEDMKVLESFRLNGRQIKNTMSVAQKVAQKRNQQRKSKYIFPLPIVWNTLDSRFVTRLDGKKWGNEMISLREM